MAAGIIDHETGTRDIRRLSGLCRFMPITATLAMVAAAAMAGVPLLNGFLSKEMFFAETVEIHDQLAASTSRCPISPRWPACSASPIRCASSTTCSSARRRRDLPRDAARAAALDARSRSSFWCWPASSSASLPALTDRALPRHGGACRSSAPRRPSTAWRSGTASTLPLLMSVIALVGGVVALPGAAALSAAAAIEGPPLLRRLEGPAHLRARARHAVLATGARRSSDCSARGACSRSCGCWSCVARRWPRLGRSTRVALEPGDLRRAAVRSRASRWSGSVGIACALGAAWQAKFHRLAALILLGGAGLVTCITFVWFSAPDLALTQLLVEIVTTVLLLLGLRWLPKRIETPDRARATRVARRLRRAARPRASPSPPAPAWRRLPTR